VDSVNICAVIAVVGPPPPNRLIKPNALIEDAPKEANIGIRK
jgi:hypothetical protein